MTAHRGSLDIVESAEAETCRRLVGPRTWSSIITSVALSMALTGCSLLGPRPTVENRFRNQLPRVTDGAPQILVNVATGPSTTTDTSVALNQLSDRGQAALINQLKGKPPVTIKGTPQATLGFVSQNSVTRHIVVAIRPKEFLPLADRVDALKIKLTVVTAEAQDWALTSWTQASNGQTVVEVGTSTNVQSSKLTASTGVGGSATIANAAVSGEADASRTSVVDIKDTTDFDAAVDDRGNAWLNETAGWRVSLAHNLSMDAVITSPFNHTHPEFLVTTSALTRDDPRNKDKTLPEVASNVRITQLEVDMPNDMSIPVCGYAELTYRVRHIVNSKGQATFSESDDIIEEHIGTSHTYFQLSPASIPQTYMLDLDGAPLFYKQGINPPYAITFIGLDDANAFLAWLQQVRPQQGRLANASVGKENGSGVTPLTDSEVSALAVAVYDRDLIAEAAENNAMGCDPKQLDKMLLQEKRSKNTRSK